MEYFGMHLIFTFLLRDLNKLKIFDFWIFIFCAFASGRPEVKKFIRLVKCAEIFVNSESRF